METESIAMEGKYFGTEIEEKWWKRYTKDKMLARGNGELSYNNKSIQFRRKLTHDPITIDFKEILEFKIGSWHAGQWGAGNDILKVIWVKDGKNLCSGFAVSKNSKNIPELIKELEELLAISKIHLTNRSAERGEARQ